MKYPGKTNMCKIFNWGNKSATRAKDFMCMLGSRINIRAFVVFTIICAIVNLGLLCFELKEIFVEGGVDFFPDYYRNYIYMLMIFCGYFAYIWKKRQVRQDKGKQMDIKKKIWTVVLLLVHIYAACIGILFFMCGLCDGLSDKSWDLSYNIADMLKGACLLVIAVLVWVYLLKRMLYIWYPVSSYCALYVWNTEHLLSGGMERFETVLYMLAVMFVFGIIEGHITVFLNLGIPKWIWKYICGFFIFILLVYEILF